MADASRRVLNKTGERERRRVRAVARSARTGVAGHFNRAERRQRSTRRRVAARIVQQAPSHRWFGRGRTRALLCLATVGALAYTTSTAFWTDDVQVTGTTFTSGTLNLQVNNGDSATTSTLSMTSMVPGNTSAEVLTVKNAGTIPAKYTLTGGLTGTNATDFAGAGANGLLLTIRAGGTKTGTGSTSTCTGGTVAYGPTALTATTTTTILTRRPTTALATNATEALCFQVTFASTAPTTLQGKTANAVFTATGTSDVS